ncbi:MAG: hypothetical protein ABFD89_11405 [Bryobacteraceae bacterium]
MNEFKKLRKSVRREAVARKIVARVAKATGKSPSAVSRTLAGRTDRPDPAVTQALWAELRAMGLLGSDAA